MNKSQTFARQAEVVLCPGKLEEPVKLAGLSQVAGYASLLVTIAFLSGVQITVMGMVGQYVALIRGRGVPPLAPS